MYDEVVVTKKRLIEIMKGRKVLLQVRPHIFISVTQQEACRILDDDYSCVEVDDSFKHLRLNIIQDDVAIEKIIRDLMTRYSFETLLTCVRDNWRFTNTLEEKTVKFFLELLQVEDVVKLRKQLVDRY